MVAGGTRIPAGSAQSPVGPGWQQQLPRAWLLSQGDPWSRGWCRSWAGTSGCSLPPILPLLEDPALLEGHEMIYSPCVCKELDDKGRTELKASLEHSHRSLFQHSSAALCCFTRSESRDDHPEKKKSNYSCSTSNALLMLPSSL